MSARGVMPVTIGAAKLPRMPPPDASALQHAIALGEIGWSSFPVYGVLNGQCTCSDRHCKRPGKHPMIHGAHRGATSEDVHIRRSFMRAPHANLGIHPGQSGVIILDVDPRNGGDQTLAHLQARLGPLDPAVEARTGGGGRHLYFHAPASSMRLPSKLGPGLDLLHGNKYPVIPPSTHLSGQRYEWEHGRDPWSGAFLLLPLPVRYLYQNARAGTRRAAEGTTEETPEAEARLRSALEFIRADTEYDEWRDVIFAIQSTGWACAEDIAVDWSLKAPGFYTDEGFRLVWDHAKADHPGGRKIGSIFYQARQNGWVEPRRDDLGTRAKFDVISKPDTSEVPKAVEEFGIPPESQSHDAPDTGGDISNGRRFAQHLRGQLLYVRGIRRWKRWGGAQWAPSDGEEVQAAKRIADDMVLQTSQAFIRDPSDANKRNWILTLGVHRNAKRLHEMLEMASSEPGMSVADPTAFDADPWLLGVRNGVVDLRTGTLLAAEPSQLISRQAAADFDPAAECPRWQTFLMSVFGDPEVIAFVQRAAGYSLTGLVDEEKLFFTFGTGANGKSVFANIICDVFGDYAVTVGTELLARTKHEGEAARYRVRLQGARLALANEVGSGDTWDDKQVKELVSRERIPARALYGEAYDFMPSHKLWIRANHKPGILDAGYGLWRRFVLIGFEKEVPEGERVQDLDRQILAAERDGILRWLIEGCLAWQDGGLRIPAAIARATAEYREDSDVLGAWIDERCEASPGERLNSNALYADFRDYIRDAGMVAPAQPVFVRRMGQRGFRQERSNGVAYIYGLKLRSRSEGGGYGGL